MPNSWSFYHLPILPQTGDQDINMQVLVAHSRPNYNIVAPCNSAWHQWLAFRTLIPSAKRGLKEEVKGITRKKCSKYKEAGIVNEFLQKH